MSVEGKGSLNLLMASNRNWRQRNIEKVGSNLGGEGGRITVNDGQRRRASSQGMVTRSFG